jgi:DNA polymerase IV
MSLVSPFFLSMLRSIPMFDFAPAALPVMQKTSGLNWLLLDLNSFFASCEQQERPELRGKPIAVVPMLADTTCAIAASYEAKKYGIKTGTLVAEARRLCPDIQFIPARHRLYVEYHHRILAAVEQCVPIETVLSIDEVACRLTGNQRRPDMAVALAHKIKATIRDQVGEAMTSSIGLAPNKFLAKLASDMQKPDGLTMLQPEDLPGKILPLPLRALPGIGPGMALRLARAGITTMQELWAADRFRLRLVWGGVAGVKFHELLHGADLETVAGPRRSLGHQHVLAPRERGMAGATTVLRQLLSKAAGRMRDEKLYARRLLLDVKWVGEGGYWHAERSFHETQSTVFLLRQLMDLWCQAPTLQPLRVGITLCELTDATQHQFDMFDRPAPAVGRLHANLDGALDALNRKFGRDTVAVGLVEARAKSLLSKIAFQRVPGLAEL